MTGTALPTTEDLRTRARTSLARIGATVPEGTDFQARTPITGENLFGLTAATAADVEEALAATREAFLTWRTAPAPGAANSSVAWASCCATTRVTWPTSSPSRRARSARRRSVRSRR